MMKKAILRCEKELDGNIFLELIQPCVYLWFRENECLYVGQSRTGLARLLRGHHIINVVDKVQPKDRFEFQYTNPEYSFAGNWELTDVLLEEERRLIRLYRPKYNTQGNEFNYEKEREDSLQTDKVPKMSVVVHAKENLAKVLFSELPDENLLGHPYCSSSSTRTDEELTKRIETLRETQKDLLRLETLNKLQKRAQ